MQRILVILALFAGLVSAADRPVLVLSGTGQYQPLASGDAYLIRDAGNFVLNTTTGTKFGTATSQKLAFYNSTPVIQQTGDVATALSTLGLVASPTVVATTAIDSTFRILGSGDATKKLAFEVDAQTAGKVLTIDTGAQTLDRTVTFPVLGGAANFVMREAALTDNAIVRADGTTGLIQDSGVIISDANSVSGIANLTSTATIKTGAATLDADATSAFGTPWLTTIGNNSAADGLVVIANNANANGARISGAKTRSTSTDADTIVANGDVLTIWNAFGADGAAYRLGGSLGFVVDSTPGSSDMPTSLVLKLSPDGSATPSTYLTVSNAGLFTIAGSVTQSGATTFSTGTGAFTHNGTVTIVSGKTLILSDATDSTSIITGSEVTAGGVGIGKALWVGGLANIAGTLTTAGSITVNANEIRNVTTAPQTYWKESDGSADNKTWAIVVNAEVWKLRIFNDAEGVASDIFSIARSTTTVGTITIGGATTQATNWAQTGATTISTGTGTFTHNGSVTIVSGKTLTHNDATLHRTATTLTNGAGALTGTLTNSPATGNPTKWIPIDDNGTTRYIPAW